MNKINMTEMMRLSKTLKENGEKFTLMGIGPMSKVCIEATLDLARERDFPVMLIASRNQVDSDEYGHGYVCNWDQKRFISDTLDIAAKVGFDGLLYFCRDHGGPWQRDEERASKLETKKAIDISVKSYMNDVRAGFHLLHVDPTKDPHIKGAVPLDVVISRTVDIIEQIECERKREGLQAIAYEVGTEETNGGLTSEAAFEKFITELLSILSEKKLPNPEFIVGQTGTLTRLTENVGHFNYKSARRLSEIAQAMNVGIKEHNCDYQSDAILIDHSNLNITASNIAPEFGVVETRAYLELAKIEAIECSEQKASKLKAALSEEAIKSQRWRKWMVDESVKNMSIDEVAKNRELTELITDICGHYTFETVSVKKELEIMQNNLSLLGIDTKSYAVKKVKDSIDRYAFLFNLYGITSKLLKV